MNAQNAPNQQQSDDSDRPDMNRAGRFVGLDVHKREVTFCIVDASGQVVRNGRFELIAGRLLAFIDSQLHPGDQVALESTTNCWAIAEHLATRVARVVVSNPMATKAIANSKIKTDKVDAHVLAQLLRCDFLPEVWQPDAATRRKRQLSGRRTALVAQQTRIRNRIHSVLAMRLIIPPFRGSLFSPQGIAWLESLDETTLEAEAMMMIRSDLRMLESIGKEIAQFDQRIAELGYADDRVRLLMTMPGVSTVVATALVAAFGDIDRFASPAQAASYLGLVPSTRQSAQTTHHGPITKRGNRQARCMLVQAAQCMHRQPGPLGHFFRRIKRRKNHNVAVVATARKMAMIAWQMLKTNEPYRYSQPRSTAEKLARLRIAASGDRRGGGSAKGQKATAKLPGGSRTIASLDTVYTKEGLPPREKLSAGERRHLKSCGCEEFVDRIGEEQIIPRRHNTTVQDPVTQRA